jgi:ketosteroid isomerase-like protein
MSGTVEQAIALDGEELGVRGARVQVPCVDVIQVRDGLIASKHTYIDSITMQRQLGGE